MALKSKPQMVKHEADTVSLSVPAKIISDILTPELVLRKGQKVMLTFDQKMSEKEKEKKNDR